MEKWLLGQELLFVQREPALEWAAGDRQHTEDFMPQPVLGAFLGTPIGHVLCMA